MAVIRVPIARPVGGSAVADALKGLGQLGFLYGDLKRQKKAMELEAEDRADRKALRALQTQKAQLDIDKYRRDTAEETALMEGVENVEQAQEQRAKLDEILKQVNAQPLELIDTTRPVSLPTPEAPIQLSDVVSGAAPDTTGLGLGPTEADQAAAPPAAPEPPPQMVQMERRPEGMIKTPSLEALLKDELAQKTTIPGMESVGVPAREVSPTRMALDRLREAQRAKEAEQAEEAGVVTVTPEMSAAMPESVRALYPVGSRQKTAEMSKFLGEGATSAEAGEIKMTAELASQLPREVRELYPVGSMVKTKELRDILYGNKPGGGTGEGGGSSAPKDKLKVGDMWMGWNEATKQYDIPLHEQVDELKQNPYLAQATFAKDENGRNKITEEYTQAERDALYRSLPEEVRELAKKVAMHQANPTLAGRSKDERIAILAAANIINPNYNQHEFTMANTVARGFDKKVSSANDAIADVSLAWAEIDAIEKDWLGRTEMPWVNKGYAWVKENLTGEGVHERRLAKALNAVAVEFAMAEKGGSTPNDIEIRKAFETLMKHDNPEALRETLRMGVSLTTNRLVTLENQYERYFGKTPDRSFLNRQTIDAAKKFGYLEDIERTGLFLGPGMSARKGGAEGDKKTEECPPSPQGDPCGARKTMGGRLSEWDGKGWKALSPQESVEPGTGPLRQPSTDDVLSTFYGVGGS